MFSAVVVQILVPASDTSGGVTAAEAGHTPQVLVTLDLIVSAAAICVLLGWLGWAVTRQWHDPLSNAPPRPNRLAEDAIALAVLAYLTAVLALAAVAGGVGADRENSWTQVMIGNGAHLAGIGACLVIASSRFPGGVRQFILGTVNRPTWRPAVETGLLTLLALGLCPPVGQITIRMIETFAPEHAIVPHPTLEMLCDPDRSMRMVLTLWLGTVVLAPASEELFFRGFVQTLFVRWFGGRWKSILAASAVFGAVHYQQDYAIPALVLLGIIIGYVYERSGSLVWPIVLHSAFNLKTLLWDALGASEI